MTNKCYCQFHDDYINYTSSIFRQFLSSKNCKSFAPSFDASREVSNRRIWRLEKKTFTRRPILCDSFYRLEVSIMARLLRSIVWQARFSWPLINNFKAPSRSMQNNNLCSWPPPAPYFYNSLSSITKKSMTLFSRKIDK